MSSTLGHTEDVVSSRCDGGYFPVDRIKSVMSVRGLGIPIMECERASMSL